MDCSIALSDSISLIIFNLGLQLTHTYVCQKTALLLSIVKPIFHKLFSVETAAMPPCVCELKRTLVMFQIAFLSASLVLLHVRHFWTVKTSGPRQFMYLEDVKNWNI